LSIPSLAMSGSSRLGPTHCLGFKNEGPFIRPPSPANGKHDYDRTGRADCIESRAFLHRTTSMHLQLRRPKNYQAQQGPMSCDFHAGRDQPIAAAPDQAPGPASPPFRKPYRRGQSRSFQRMKAGESPMGAAPLPQQKSTWHRPKCGCDDPPLLYRIRTFEHHHAGDKWLYSPAFTTYPMPQRLP